MGSRSGVGGFGSGVKWVGSERVRERWAGFLLKYKGRVGRDFGLGSVELGIGNGLGIGPGAAGKERGVGHLNIG